MSIQTTRHLILEYLQTKGIAHAQELSLVLHVTQANIRHHLSALEKEGVVFVTGQSRPNGRGRPKKLYRLTKMSAEHNLDRLSSALLKVFDADLSRDEFDARMDMVAEIMVEAEFQQGLPDSLSGRLAKCILILNDFHYRSRWEAHRSSPRIVFEHCPYGAIIHEHPEICQLDKKILEKLLESEIEQLEKLKENRRGLTSCTFRLLS